jgi:XTP/dITP diphosphohydrolase
LRYFDRKTEGGDQRMTRRLKKGDKIVFATHNQGKLEELRALLAPCGMSAISAAELNLSEPEETGGSFAENALLKARAAALAAKLPALADDSGLCINALDGAPGIYSARWAEGKSDFSAAIARVENELKKQNAKNARAHFICALALAFSDGKQEIFEGRVDGTLTFPPRGRNGFGYDPIFIPDGGRLTFAEMESAQKHKLSHRARAFAAFAQACLPQENAA